MFDIDERYIIHIHLLTWIQQRGRREDHQISMESMAWFQDHFAGDQCGIPSNRGFPVKSMHG